MAKAELEFGIQECSKCRYKIRCEECVYNEKDIAELLRQEKKDTANEIWEDCIDEIMRGCGDDKEFWVMKILIETFKKYGVGFEVE